MSIEELFRICDYDYKHEVPTSLFRKQIGKFKLDIKPKSLDRICSVLDEDCNGSISLKEMQFALEAYGSVGEPFEPAEGEVGYQHQAVFKLCAHMASKRLNEEQMFNAIDIDKNLVLNLDEMTTILSALG
jgi:Ca2+-binding EF-hand superfamily protein